MIRLIQAISIVFSFCFAATAHNGATSYSYLTHNLIKVDGDLSDWPEALEYRVGNGVKNDYEAYFKTCYDSLSNFLYVSLKVIDDSHVIDPSDRRDWERREDRHLLFLDFDHHMDRGSGVIVLFGNQNGKDLVYAPNGWDPFHESIQKEHFEVAVKRIGNQTIYEWRVKAPVDLNAYSTFGLDHYVHDVDQMEEEVGYYEWTQGGFKDRIPSRLGDIVLLPEETSFGLAEGSVVWQDGDSARKLPSKVLIESMENRNFWTTALLDSVGRFSKDLPIGNYEVKPMLRTAERNGVWDIQRVDESKSVVFAVEDKINRLPELGLSVVEKPDFLIPVRGLLSTGEEIDEEHLDVVVNAFKDYYQIPGVSLAIIEGGILVYEQQYGVANSTTNTPVSKKTRFEIASVSKPIFAFAVLRLVGKGMLDLDQPLSKYLPFKSISHDPRHKKITARLVLSHQTGLPNWLWNSPRDWENEEKGEFIGDPGDGHFYSGEAYEYLMRVVEKVTGKNIHTVMKHEVYDVFGMTQSSHTADASFASEIAVGHLEQFPMYWEVHHEPWVAGSMYSTALDLSRFSIGILNKMGLSAQQYEEMLKAHVEIEPWVMNYGGDKQFWSLGFEIEDSPFGRFYHHEGSNGDFESRFCINPEKRYGYVLLTNNGHGEYLDRVLQRTLFTGRQDTATPVFK